MGVNSYNLHNHINENIINQFWLRCFKKEDPNKCWSWYGSAGKDGYPRLSINKKSIEIHRISYVIHKGSIPLGLLIRHTCNNPRCTNPNHLILGTKKQNEKDRKLAGHDLRKLTLEQVKEIRKRCANLETFKEIAKDYNITASTVNKIKHHQRHKGD